MTKAYSVVGISGSGTTKTIASVTGGTTVRARIFEWKVGCNDAPADQTWQPSVARFTNPGTSTSYTPYPADPQEVASLCSGGITHTVEPTYPTNIYLDQVPLNQRGTWKWQAVPGCEFVAAAATSNGAGLLGVGASAAMHFSGSLFYYE